MCEGKEKGGCGSLFGGWGGVGVVKRGGVGGGVGGAVWAGERGRGPQWMGGDLSNRVSGGCVWGGRRGQIARCFAEADG